MNQYNEWRPEDARLYQPSAKPPPGTGYGPQPVEDYDPSADYAYGQDPEPPRRRRTGRKILITAGVGLVALFALVLLLGYIGSTRPAAVVVPSVQPVPTVPMPPVQAAPQAPQLAPGVFGDGIYEVGTGPGLIEPGRYHYSGGAALAYWARARDTSGETSSIIANGMPKGPATITIKKTDGAVIFQGDATWQRVS